MSIVILFFALGYRSYLTGANLRSEICNLELGKSSFDEVSRIFRQYQGHIFSYGGLPASCAPEGCTYYIFVENPFSRAFRIGPRATFVARVSVSENVLSGRELIFAGMREGRELDVCLIQSSNSDWNGDARIARYSKVETVEVRLPAHASARFAQLADSFNLSCLAIILGCKGPADILPFLKDKLR